MPTLRSPSPRPGAKSRSVPESSGQPGISDLPAHRSRPGNFCRVPTSQVPRMAAPLICLEFNELTPHLMEEFIAAGKLPNFARLRNQSQTFLSDAQASGEWLNPWVQWVSVHSGLTPEEHGVFRLSNAHKLEQPAIWDLLSDAGHSVWVCGSMNAWYHAPLNGRLLPDPWCQHTPAYPEREFDDYLGFIQKNVQEYGNTQSPTTKKDALRFVSFMVRNGLSFGTGLRILKQL